MVAAMGTNGAVIPTEGWSDLLARLDRGTILVVGETGTGKSALARYLLAQLGRGLGRVALIDCDLADGTVGAPGCLGLATTAPWEAPAALWFVGATSPAGHLLPVVVGAARLAERARAAGAGAVILDTGDLVGCSQGRTLKLHKALAAKVDQVVAIQRDGELEPLLTLLADGGRALHRLRPSPHARPPAAGARRQHRDGRWRAHFAGAAVRLFGPRRFVSRDWVPGPGSNGGSPAPGTVVGLLDDAGFCLGLGRIEEVHPDCVAVSTAFAGDVARLRVGGLRLAEDGSEATAATGAGG